MINQTPIFIEFLVNEFTKNGIPAITPPGGLGAHLDAKQFCKHIPQSQFPAASLIAAIYLVTGARGMERGTVSEDRNLDGTEHFADMELVRLAVPKRVFSLSHLKFVADRVNWLYQNRELIGGLEWVEEPKVLRFFLGKLKHRHSLFLPCQIWLEHYHVIFGTLNHDNIALDLIKIRENLL